MTIQTKLKEMRERCEAASEGPWGVDSGMKYTTGKTCEWQHVMGARGKAICNTSAFEEVKIGSEVVSSARNGSMADAQFISAARSDMPALISALEVCLGALSKIAFCEIMVNDIEYKTFNDAFINMADHSAKAAIAKAEAILS